MSHDLNSIMIYIHPPLAIIGYIFIITSFLFFLFNKYNIGISTNIKKSMYLAWFFNLLGLITGMIWAGLAFNAPWSWDPKESVTLLIFISISISTVQYDKSRNISILFLILSIIFILLNLLITFGNIGYHSYGF